MLRLRLFLHQEVAIWMFLVPLALFTAPMPISEHFKFKFFENSIQSILILFTPLPHLSPTPASSSYPPKFKSSFFNTHKILFVLTHVLPWSVADLSGVTILKRTSCPSPNSHVAKNPSAKGGTSCPPPLSVLGFGLALILCTSFGRCMRMLSLPLSSFVELPCCVRKTLLCCGCLQPSGLTIFPPPLLR